MASRPTRSRKPPPQQLEQQSRAKWTTSLTQMLADLMVDQVQKGNRQNNSFGKKAWKYMCDDFYKKTGLKWDKEQLKNRYAVLRRQYVTVKLLLDQSDFSWEESTGTITAKDEAWDKYIKEHPDAETIRSTGCPIYKQLCTIFSEAGTNGNGNGNGKYDESAEYEDGTPCLLPCPEPLNVLRDASSTESEDVADIADGRDKVHSTTPTTPPRTSRCKRGRKGIDDVIADAILEMAAASKLRAAAVKQCNNRFPIADCVKALDEMLGVNEQVYFAALDLFDNPNARETFLSLKSGKRLTWLHGKCTTPSSSID